MLQMCKKRHGCTTISKQKLYINAFKPECKYHKKGGITGGVQCVITGPMELVKTRMQVTGIGESKTKSSLIKTAKHIYKTNGLIGFTTGFGATLTREIPAFMCYFGSYDMFLKIQNYNPGKYL